MAVALVLAESVHQPHRAGKYIASALLWSATLHTYSTLDIDFAQLYWQTTAVYIAALAVRQRQRGDAEGMAVQARALVACRDIRQPVGRFDGKDAKDFHRNAQATFFRTPAVLRLRVAQLQAPHVQRMALQSPHTAKSTEPKCLRQCSQ